MTKNHEKNTQHAKSSTVTYNLPRSSIMGAFGPTNMAIAPVPAPPVQ